MKRLSQTKTGAVSALQTLHALESHEGAPYNGSSPLTRPHNCPDELTTSRNRWLPNSTGMDVCNAVSPKPSGSQKSRHPKHALGTKFVDADADDGRGGHVSASCIADGRRAELKVHAVSPLRSRYITLTGVVTMTRITPRNSGIMSSFTYSASILGLTVASAFGIYKSWDYCRRLQLQANRRGQAVEELRRALADTEGELLALRLRLADAQAAVLEKDEVVEVLRQEMERVRNELANLEAFVEGYQEEKEEMNKELEALRIVNVAIRDDAVYEARSSPEEDFDTSTDQREDDSSSSLRTDESSADDVTNLVRTLNSEISDVAVAMAKLLETEEIEEGDEDEEQSQRAYSQAVEVLGATMVDLLRKQNRRRNPMFLQWAFQACMSAFSDWMISSWYFEDPQSEQVLTSIYEQLRETEEQAVAGRWRVLTRTYVQSVLKDRPDLSEYFLDAFSSILIAIGFKGTPSHFQNIIKRRFGDRMAGIGMQALNLNKTIGQELVSSEVDPIYVAPGTSFDASVMDDGIESPEKRPDEGAEPENILCTVELGLLWALKEHGGSRWEEKILLRPRVLRESELQALGLV
ncbi:hypothetical protein HGRIS_002816 [Hohenbuehelia grisea]|uniref:Uncharacterized protein n=1 Tax=Hohenbuehelia grisea TaxID=104357 RepID=A0ABR3JLK4_9AGAR